MSMDRKAKAAKRADAPKAATAASPLRPLGSLHKDHGWTPEKLQAELEAQGLDYEEEVAKQRQLITDLAARHLAGRKAGDTPAPKTPGSAEPSILDEVPTRR
jgi:hypothetical protein